MLVTNREEDRAIKTILLDGNYKLVSDRRLIVFSNKYHHELHYSKYGYKHIAPWEVSSSKILSKYKTAIERYIAMKKVVSRCWKPTIKSILQEFKVTRLGYLYPTVSNDYNARLHCKDIIGLLDDEIKPLDKITDKVGIKKVDDLISEFPSLNLYKVTDVCYLVTNEYGCYGLIYKDVTPRYIHWVYSKWIKLLIKRAFNYGIRL